MRSILIIFVILSTLGYSQPTAYVYGNDVNLCLTDTLQITQLKELKNLNSSDAVFIFSGAGNGLSKGAIDTLIEFVYRGGGLYIGAENWPLQTEANQITSRLFNKSSFGFYTSEIAESATNGNLSFQDLDTIPSGKTAVAFPMDHRLTVEAWVEDQPLLLSGYHGKGRIIIDGGYSRFYCDQITVEGKQVLLRIYNFLNGD